MPEGDVAAATKAILEILRDPAKRENMGKAGNEWIDKTFDETKNVPAIEALTYDLWSKSRVKI